MSIRKDCNNCVYTDLHAEIEPCCTCRKHPTKYINWKPLEKETTMADIKELNGAEYALQSYADFVKQRQFKSGAVRDARTGKGRCDLLPASALLRLARHYEKGATHYGDRNWEKGIDIADFIDSGFRHLLKYMDGQVDEDHLCAAVWNLIGVMWTEEKHPNLKEAYYEQFKKNTNEGCDDSNTEGV